MSEIKRRDFIKKGLTAAAATSTLGVLASCSGNGQKQEGSAAVLTGKTYEWKMVTTWPPHFPLLGEGADKLATWIEEMSGGRIKIHVYGGGELVPPMEAFDAVSSGIAEIGHGSPYYWAGKSPAAQLFTAMPFGLNAQQMNTWLLSAGGLKLWEDLYSNFNLVPFVVGNTGVQMGGWFNRKIRSIDDLKGLKMRIPGLGGKVIAKAGGSAILSPGSEIYTNLERGVIDATEWVGPYHDYLMGFHKIAKYYYYPGWHEAGSVLECFINKSAFNELPADLKAIIRAATRMSSIWMLSEFELKNAEYLAKIRQEESVDILAFPPEVLQLFRQYSAEVLEELGDSDPAARAIYESQTNFKKAMNDWAGISEKIYYESIS
jgi:TRAP-type mannitol/chloroaromatic compound transport system substrate-binding protein